MVFGVPRSNGLSWGGEACPGAAAGSCMCSTRATQGGGHQCPKKQTVLFLFFFVLKSLSLHVNRTIVYHIVIAAISISQQSVYCVSRQDVLRK